EHVRHLRIVLALLSKHLVSPRVKSFVPEIFCRKWAVVTTIFNPSFAIYRLLNFEPERCLCVVLDLKSPENFRVVGFENRTIVLTVAKQKELPFRLLGHVPWNSFARKNIGYLYAMASGADEIFDFDDDNVLLAPSHTSEKFSPSRARIVSCPEKAFMLYPAFGLESVWPRGFPLHLVKRGKHSRYKCRFFFQKLSPSVVQSLAGTDPDVDALYRLTQPLPLFPAPAEQLVPAPGTFIPFNAQATLLQESVFWGAMLPATVPGRVSDIWRSFFMQRVFQDTNQSVAFVSALVDQHRSHHDYLSDFDAETDLYMRSGALLDLLMSIQMESSFAHMKILDLYVLMVQFGVIGEADARMVQAFIHDLQDLMLLPAQDSAMKIEPPHFEIGYEKLPAWYEPTGHSLAVCVVGTARVGARTVWPFYKNVLQDLDPNADIFVVDSGSKGHSEIIPYFDPTHVVPTSANKAFVADWEAIIRARSNHHNYLQNKTHFGVPRWLTAGFQLSDWLACRKAILEHEEKTITPYDFIFKMRADSLFALPMKLSSDPVVTVQSRGNLTQTDDQFAFGPRDLMLKYLNTINILKTTNFSFQNLENALWLSLKIQGVPVRGIIAPHCRVEWKGNLHLRARGGEACTFVKKKPNDASIFNPSLQW
ncbi:hypothetical protein DUNSADRAFT_6309, partial [Dunaliella salina]